MKLQQLRYFVTVIETGSVTEAARKLNVSQPALSTALKALETELGGVMLDRKRSSLRATPLGEQFHQRALNILKECDMAKVEFQRGSSRPRVKLGILPTIPMGYVLDFKRRFASARPEVDLLFRDGAPDVLLSWLSCGRIDAAILALDVAQSGGWLPLFSESIVLMCAPDHPMAKRASLSIQDLDGEDFVLRSHCERSRDAQDILSVHGVRPKIVLRTDQDHRAFEAVRARLGVTVAPVSLATDLTVVPLDNLGLTRTIGLLFSPRIEPPLLDEFMDALREAAEAGAVFREPAWEIRT